MSELSTAALILDRAEYAQRRGAARQRVIPLRTVRRVQLGESLALEFENAETLLYQVQEMIYAEGIHDRSTAEQEVAAYSRLLPSPTSLTATMFVELLDAAKVRNELQRLKGVQHSIFLVIGNESIRGTEIPSPDEDHDSDETSSVHFLRFSLSTSQRESLLDQSLPLSLAVHHPQYEITSPISDETRASLSQDLA